MRVCTDVGCSLEQDALMTDTRAHRTSSSSRGLPPPEEPWPAKAANKKAISRFSGVLCCEPEGEVAPRG